MNEDMLPDKQKLRAWVAKFNQTTIPWPRLENKEAADIVSRAMTKLDALLEVVLEETEEL